MNKNEIIERNRNFYCMVAESEISKKFFAEAVLRSLFGPVTYGPKLVNDSSYIIINSMHIKDNNFQDDFIKVVRGGILKKVSEKIPFCITGNLSTDVKVVYNPYKFNFQIINGYEEHQSRLINSFFLLSNGEQFNHILDLKITFIG